MRVVRVSPLVELKLEEIEFYLVDQLKFSREDAFLRVERMQKFLRSLANPGDYALCRFRRWKERGWRCVPFEKNWVFAYEVIGEVVALEDMSHVAALREIN